MLKEVKKNKLIISENLGNLTREVERNGNSRTEK